MDMGADVGMGLGFKGLRVAWDISSYARVQHARMARIHASSLTMQISGPNSITCLN